MFAKLLTTFTVVEAARDHVDTAIVVGAPNVGKDELCKDLWKQNKQTEDSLSEFLRSPMNGMSSASSTDFAPLHASTLSMLNSIRSGRAMKKALAGEPSTHFPSKPDPWPQDQLELYDIQWYGWDDNESVRKSLKLFRMYAKVGKMIDEANAVIVVFDAANPSSFVAALAWRDMLVKRATRLGQKQPAPCVLVMNNFKSAQYLKEEELENNDSLIDSMLNNNDIRKFLLSSSSEMEINRQIKSNIAKCKSLSGFNKQHIFLKMMKQVSKIRGFLRFFEAGDLQNLLNFVKRVAKEYRIAGSDEASSRFLANRVKRVSAEETSPAEVENQDLHAATSDRRAAIKPFLSGVVTGMSTVVAACAVAYRCGLMN